MSWLQSFSSASGETCNQGVLSILAVLKLDIKLLTPPVQPVISATWMPKSCVSQHNCVYFQDKLHDDAIAAMESKLENLTAIVTELTVKLDTLNRQVWLFSKLFLAFKILYLK